MMIFSIALRNLLLQWGRFKVLLATLLLGSTVFVLLLGVTTSMTKVMGDKASRYFAGDVVVWGESKTQGHYLKNGPAIFEAMKTSGIPVKSYCRRTVAYSQHETTLFFAGSSQRQRRMIGVDWAYELENFKTMSFVAGGPEGMVSGKGILISEDAARKLSARVGDDCMILVTTDTGQKNSLDLRIEGIFRDSSFFGYSSYVDIRALNRILGLPEDTVSEIGMILPDPSQKDAAAKALWAHLDKSFPMFPPVTGKASYSSVVDPGKLAEGESRSVVMTLDIRLAQVKDLLDALLIIGYGLILVFLGVVIIGVNNTYRLVVVERTKEIGTMRALGMQKTSLLGTFLAESCILGVMGAVLGLVAGGAILWGFTWIDLGDQVLTAMFLEKGRFVWALPASAVAVVLVSMVLAAVAGAFLPALKAARMNPLEALRHDS